MFYNITDVRSVNLPMIGRCKKRPISYKCHNNNNFEFPYRAETSTSI